MPTQPDEERIALHFAEELPEERKGWSAALPSSRPKKEAKGAHDQDQVAGWKSGLTKPAPRTLSEVLASGPMTQSMLRCVPSGN